MAYNAAERKDIRKAEKRVAVAESLRKAFLTQAMASVEGRAWINDLLIRCHLFRNPMSESDRWTAFACGEMNIGQQVLADIMETCPDQYIQMQREADQREHARHNDNPAANGTGAAAEQSGSEGSRRDVEGYDPTSGDEAGNEA